MSSLSLRKRYNKSTAVTKVKNWKWDVRISWVQRRTRYRILVKTRCPKTICHPPVSATSGGVAPRWRWIRLPAWGFLLVFCGNHDPKTHRYWARGIGQTDRQTDGWTDGPQQCLAHMDGVITKESNGSMLCLMYSILQVTMSALFVMWLELCPSVNSWYIEMLLSWRTYRNSRQHLVISYLVTCG